MSLHQKYDFKNQHYAGQEGRLIPLLQKAQEREGYISRDKILEIHRECGIPLTHIYGVATFYSQFRLKPVGKNIVRVCHGTACHVSGAKDISKAVEETLGCGNNETTPDRQYTIETVSCLGCCSLAPVVMVNQTTHGNLSPREVKKVLKGHQQRNAAKAGVQ